MSAVNYFTDGLKQYREGRWEKAIGAFKETLSLNPEDKLTHMYIERCEYMKEHSPEGDWDGVFKMTSK
ncbi:MAG: tetratricopeptide repeat protein [Candidatus Latescibacteria bacterium]|nr:tetratricopeptide repeat protein [Candidatus Latescibacterota bacterium]